MKVSDRSRYALSYVAAALLAGCGGSQPPIAAPGAMQQTPAIATHAAHGKSWMLPDAASQDLLYISDDNAIKIYAYPQGNLVGTLRGGFYLAGGECVDGNGNVFIVNTGNGRIFEYAHGGTKRIATLHSPTQDPVGCAVDPATSDLAVGSEGFGSGATVAVFKHERGKPTVYQDSSFYQFYFCGYDDKGNLFADGLTAAGSGHFGLVELPRGKSALRNIAVNQYIRFPGGVQWDGQHLAIGDQFNHIYRFAIKGSTTMIVGITELDSGAQYVQQSWIQGQTIIAPNVYIPKEKPKQSDVLLYPYPRGGAATKKITRGILDANGAVVSLAPNR
jgi:hypothetical protein